MSYSSQAQADISATNIACQRDGVAFELSIQGQQKLVQLPLMGRYFVSLRLLCSMAFPPFAGLIAILISSELGVG